MSLAKTLHFTDFYKVGHQAQYEPGTELIFSNLTPRSTRIGGDGMVLFGLQYYIKRYLIQAWEEEFFSRPLSDVIEEYQGRCHGAGLMISTDHIEALHNLSYLPIEIRALPEGSLVPIGVPGLVLWNTHPEFAWLTNYLETSLSAILWRPCVAATLALKYRDTLDHYTWVTGGDMDFIQWQAHDFSMRGQPGLEAAQLSGAAHLTIFRGTDTVAALDFLEEYYQGADTFLGGSVPATEHSVMCVGGQEDEVSTYRRLLTEVYPSGVVSVVSDTWDYWKVLTETLPELKDEILARDGKLVIRPDSGDPVKIICGDLDAPLNSPENRGSFQVLWDIFGGTYNKAGFRELDPHVGMIYGDSITPERCEEITRLLTSQGFVPNIVLGVGSFTYQYNTRDTLGIAVKATYAEVNGEGRAIFKDPKTVGDIPKKSAKGLLAVWTQEHGYYLQEEATWDDVIQCAFQPVFRNGVLLRDDSIEAIRERIASTRRRSA